MEIFSIRQKLILISNKNSLVLSFKFNVGLKANNSFREFSFKMFFHRNEILLKLFKAFIFLKEKEYH